MNSTATTNIDGVPPVTALDLVNIAGVLIDSVDIDDDPNDSTRTFRTGVKAGIVSMCKASTSAINAFGAQSLAQLAGRAPAEQHGDAQSDQEVARENAGREQRSAPAQLDGLILSSRPHSSKILGEHCAGTIVDITSGVVYEVMAMPGELTCVTWDEAKRAIQAAGGDLPTPIEMSMLGKLLGRLAFRESYWVNEKVKFDGDTEESFSYFSDGGFDFSDAKDRMSARGVRRISIGDVADENLDEVDDNTVVVPAPAIPAKAATHVRRSNDTASGPDLSDRPDLQQMRTDLLKPVPPLTGQAIVSVLDELNGIKDADDDARLAADVCTRVIDVINGLMLIVDPEQIK